MNSLPLRKSFEVLHIYENEDKTERTIISEHSNKKIHKGKKSQFVYKVSGE